MWALPVQGRACQAEVTSTQKRAHAKSINFDGTLSKWLQRLWRPEVHVKAHCSCAHPDEVMVLVCSVRACATVREHTLSPSVLTILWLGAWQICALFLVQHAFLCIQPHSLSKHARLPSIYIVWEASPPFTLCGKPALGRCHAGAPICCAVLSASK